MASLRFLLPPVSSPTVMYAAFQPLTAELEKTLGEPIELSFSADLHQFYLKAAEKRAQIVLLCPIAYLKVAHRSPYVPLVGLIPPPLGNSSVIVVRRDSSIHNVLQLRGKSFVLGNPSCAASALVPLSLLNAAGISPKQLGELHQGGTDGNALLDVAARFYDATAVAENVAAPYLRARTLRVIARSSVGPGDLIAASAEVPPQQRADLRRALLQMAHSAPATMTAIRPLATGFTAVPAGTYAPLRSLYADLYGVTLTPLVERPRWRLGIPPAFSPLAAARIFEPLRLALTKATGKAIEISVANNERGYLRQVRAGYYQFALLSPPMAQALRVATHPLATLLPKSGAAGLALVRAVGQPPLRAKVNVAYGSPYCSAKQLLSSKVIQQLGQRQLRWSPVGSERAVFSDLGQGRAEWGIVRAASVDNLAVSMPGTWKIIARAGPAPAWHLVTSNVVSPLLCRQIRESLAILPIQALAAAGFTRIHIDP
ncbi:MAG: PhnD/SsuA/transferrin family substrate-binding protein [Candidatus Igneacidithiobacillus chanchocoensis]